MLGWLRARMTLQNAMCNPYLSLVYGRTTLVSFVFLGITPDGDDMSLALCRWLVQYLRQGQYSWGAYAVAEMLYVGPLVVEVLPVAPAFCEAL